MKIEDYEIFCQRYGARVETQRGPWTTVTLGSRDDYKFQSGQQMVDIEMPLRSFDEVVVLVNHQLHEEMLRQSNPTVKQAYDQYKMLLELVR